MGPVHQICFYNLTAHLHLWNRIEIDIFDVAVLREVGEREVVVDQPALDDVVLRVAGTCIAEGSAYRWRRRAARCR